jgi:UDP-N-acetylglucosamine 3-dehydrogenase
MMGRHHARVLQSLDGVELVAVADPAGDSHRAATAFGVHSGVDAVIEAGVDLCVVATPTDTHLATALQLAAAGVHTLVEKPVAVDTRSGAIMAQAFELAGLIGCVGHIERYNPALQSLRSRLAAGDLGEVYQVATRRQGPFPTRVGDVGVVMDLATHDFDLTAWVTGQPYSEISARTAHRSGRTHEDLVAAVGTLADGTAVNHLVNWLSPMKERITVVTGARGCFVADTMSADLTFFANGVAPVEWDTFATFRGVVEGDMIRYALAKPEPLHTELVAFREAVLGRSAEVVTMREAVRTVAVAEAALLSAKTGDTVWTPLDHAPVPPPGELLPAALR